MMIKSKLSDSDKCACVLLCGGQSLRMRFDLPKTNKVLAMVDDKPLLHHILDHYQSTGIFNQIILCLGNDSEMIRASLSQSDNLSDAGWNGTALTILDTGLKSTATYRITEALKYVEGPDFFVTYADVVGNADCKEMLIQHRTGKRDVTMALVKAKMPYGRVMFDEQGRIYDFIEKPILDDWINAGLFVLTKASLKNADTNLEFESEFLPKVIADGLDLFGYQHRGFWKGIDTYKDLVALREEWKNIKESDYF